MIIREEVNNHNYPETAEVTANIDELVIRLNKLIAAGAPIDKITSGLRSEADQARINPAAPKSNHLIGAAADCFDEFGQLHTWVHTNVSTLEAIGLWCEATQYTPTWVHFQIYQPHSGNRFFIP